MMIIVEGRILNFGLFGTDGHEKACYVEVY